MAILGSKVTFHLVPRHVAEVRYQTLVRAHSNTTHPPAPLALSFYIGL